MALAGVQPETSEDTVFALRLMDPRRRDVPLAKVTCYKAKVGLIPKAPPQPQLFTPRRGRSL